MGIVCHATIHMESQALFGFLKQWQDYYISELSAAVIFW